MMIVYCSRCGSELTNKEDIEWEIHELCEEADISEKILNGD
jgi:hypothetical protein